MMSKHRRIPDFTTSKYFEPVVLAGLWPAIFPPRVNFSPQPHIIFSPTLGSTSLTYNFLVNTYIQINSKSTPTMVGWNLYRYAVLNITVEKHQVAFPIDDRKWVDSHDKGADRNVASFQANCRRERKKSPLAKEIVARPPQKRHPSPLAIAQVNEIGMAAAYSAAADCGDLEGPTYTSAGRHGVSRPDPQCSLNKGEKNTMDAKALSNDSHSPIRAADTLGTGALATAGNRLPARGNKSGRGDRDSQMAIKSFWDNAFKMSKGVSIS